MEKRKIETLDKDYFYYSEDFDTTYVLTAIEKDEHERKAFIYRFTPIYRLEMGELSIAVIYSESFDDALERNGLFRITSMEDIF